MGRSARLLGTAAVAVSLCGAGSTRGLPPFAGAYAGPELVAGAPRSFDVDSAPTCTGVATGATAYSLNFTVIGSPGAYQNAFLTVWRRGDMMPTVSTLSFDGGQLKANAAVVPADGSGSISVYVNAAAHLIIDVNGYFTNDPNDGSRFFVSGEFDDAPAIAGYNYSDVSGSRGVEGHAGGNGVVDGVQGRLGSYVAAALS